MHLDPDIDHEYWPGRSIRVSNVALANPTSDNTRTTLRLKYVAKTRQDGTRDYDSYAICSLVPDRVSKLQWRVP
jgi:hypothetical protein